MARKVSNDLFDLIRTMSRNEKIYFKRYAKRHADAGSNNYLKLFDLIDAQHAYNEKKITAKGFSPAQLPRTKHYLFKTILEALRNYHAENKVETILKDQLDQIQILYEKALFTQAWKLVKKTKKLAAYYDEFPLLLEALKWEIRLYGNDLNFKRIEKINTEQKRILDKFNEFLEMESLSNIMFGIFRSEGYTRKKSVLDRVNQIMQHPRLQGREKDLTSFLSHYHYNMIYGLFHFITGNFESSLTFRMRKVALFDEQPKYISEYFQRYRHSIFEACGITSLLYREKEFQQLQEKLQNVLIVYRKTVSKESKMVIDNFNFIYNLQFLNHQGKYHEAIQYIEDHYPQVLKSEHMLGVADKVTIDDLIARSHFGTGNYHESLKWVNGILNLPEHSIPPNIFNMARLLKLLNLYELNHYDALESVIRTSQYHFRKQKQTYRVEMAILHFFRKLPTLPTGKDRENLLHHLRSELIKLKSEPYQFFLFHDFDFIAWADSKLLDKSFADLCREKVKTIMNTP